MTARTPTALKLFFQTGDKPTQSNFGDVMDSYVNVVQTLGQSIISDVSALGTLDVSGSAAFKSNVSVSGNLSVIGNVSAAGNLFVNGTFSIAALSATTLTATGNSTLGGVTVSADTGFIKPTGIRGTTTNNNAAVGTVGEYVSSSVAPGSAINLSSGNNVNITSISLTAGDWDVWGNIGTLPAAGTTQTQIGGFTSTVSATDPGNPNGGSYIFWQGSLAGANGQTYPTGMMRLSINITTTVYLIIISSFTGSTNTGFGFIGARRVR